MSRRSGRRRAPNPERAAHGTRLVPVTQLPHLARAAKEHGTQDRLIRVDLPEPQQVKTPGGRVGQWLMSGQELKPAAPQYLTEQEIEQMDMDRAIPAPWEGGFDR